MTRRAPVSTLFPYTTLFRSNGSVVGSSSGGERRYPVPAGVLHAGENLVQHARSEEHTSEHQSSDHLVCRLLLEKKKKKSDMDLAAKGLGAKEWNNSLKTKLS